MRLGVALPVVTAHPASSNAWEAAAGIGEISSIAAAADALGYHHVTCSEHVAIPADVAAERGGTYWDPLATFGFLAATTSQIRLATNVLVLGYHHPLEVAKRYGTLDQVSGGRLVLGVGVGSLESEFAVLGAQFADRGARADDALAAIRSAFSTGRPTHDGPFYSYDHIVVEPHAAQRRVPVWVGGRTRRALRRAVELGDAFCPFALSPEEIAAMLADVERPAGFGVVLTTGRLDPIAAADSALRQLNRLRDAGATVVSATIASSSADHHIEQLESLKNLATQLDIEFTPPEESVT
ncbi:LLM class F420-dependent oxidoreductase [Gordonia sp. TBRC 11910]|uniref:LLM class F420-dependent oxidoreductase n=1 Tax=Gordonia asplenii TaxID=2725283 RepID=A0A848KZC4_9ACTN|nr:LLM class F420-dependent oxidoreductase [Gordonia asplenii]NMO04070.1 LLM class F420-dependent oxidoreductase [Gordonia asplenii]